jgi:hypothetical protein
MAFFEVRLPDAFEKASAALITIAAERITVRLALSQTARQRAILEANNLRNQRIRNGVLVSTAVLGATGLAWIAYKKVA